MLPHAVIADERAVLPVTVNGVAKGDFVAVIRGDDVLLGVRSLAAAGVHGFTGTRERVDGEEFVSLASLRPQVTFAIDPQSLILAVTVPTQFLPTTNVSLRSGRPPGVAYLSSPSAFLNYALSGSNLARASAFTELGVSSGGRLAYTSASRNPDGTLVRGLSYLQLDDRAALRRTVIGDSYASAGILGGAVQMGGISVGRSFGLDPYLIRYPTLSLTGAVTTPSTADVYVNGALVQREQLAPGAFDLSNLQIPTGSGMAQVVIRDAFGQEHVLTSPFYASTAVLAKGLQDYSYNLGYLRNVVAGDNSYRSLSFMGFHRFGLTDSLTPEFRLEASAHLVSGGAGLSWRLPFGEISGSAAWSQAAGVRGAAGALSYQYITRTFTIGVGAIARSDRYATLSLAAAQDRARLDLDGFAGVQVTPRCTVSLQVRRTEMRDAMESKSVSLATTLMVYHSASLFISGTRSHIQGRTSSGAFVGFTIAPGQRTTASVSSDSTSGPTLTSAEVQQALPVGEGFGYRVHALTSQGRSLTDGSFQYQGPFGLYELDASRTGGNVTATLSAAGSLVAIGGNLFAARTIGDSFALIRVPGVEGVRGLANNQVVGRTDARGELLVPTLLPYYGNRLSFDDHDVPMDYEIGQTERTVAPPSRGGAVVTFPVHRYQAFRGLLRVVGSGGEVIPADGELSLTVEGTRVASPIGVGGEFEFADVAPGRYAATIIFAGGECRFSLAVPDSKATIVDLGFLRCIAGAGQGR